MCVMVKVVRVVCWVIEVGLRVGCGVGVVC